MEPRERFLSALSGKESDEPFFWESGILREALLRWWAEGLPRSVDVFEHFGLSRVADVSVSWDCVPPLERQVAGPPLRDRASWENLKRCMSPFSPERKEAISPFLERRNRKITDERWLGSGFGGSFDPADGLPSMLRILGPTYWLVINAGLQGAAFMLYDDPLVVEEIYEYYAWFIRAQLEEILPFRAPDIVVLNEEATVKGGPVMAPAMYRRIVLPRIRTITEACRERGVPFVCVESGGDVASLVPLWSDVGVNALTPVDIAGGTDPVGLRRRHPDLALIGGISREALHAGIPAISREIDSHGRFLSRDGRSIPCIDAHFGITENVSFDVMQFYIGRLHEEIRAVS